MARRQGVDDGRKLRGRQKTRQPSVLSLRVAVDIGAELQCETVLPEPARPIRARGPRCRLRHQSTPATRQAGPWPDQRQHPGFGNEQVPLALWVTRSRPAGNGGQWSPRTTQLCDRTKERLTQDEV